MGLRILAFLLFLFLFHVDSAVAQEDWEDDVEDEYMDDAEEASDQELIWDMFSDIAENPIDINEATREDLSQLPFLSPQDIEAIIDYTHHYKPILSIGELGMIEGLDMKKQRMLAHFIIFGEKEKKDTLASLANIMKYGKHKIILTGKIPTYKRRGDDGAYQGDPLKHNIRYDFTFTDKLRVGFVGAKNHGEPFFKGCNGKGYDFYSFYASLKNLGILKHLVVGRYRVRFGMGLVINSDFLLGKSAQLMSSGKIQNRFRVHSSINSSRYLQGAATTLSLGKGFEVSMFGSYRYLDATLNSDGTISSIPKSVYHRTQTEINKKNNTSQTTFGGHLSWKYKKWYAGASVVHTSLSRELKPNTEVVYRRYYPAGKTFTNAGVDYGYKHSKFSAAGEFAVDKSGNIATINTVSYTVDYELMLTAQQRFYSKKYQSLFAQSFCDGGSVQNESGFYVGASWRAFSNMIFTAYVDYAYFAWPKYQAAQSSHSWDAMLQADYLLEKWKFSGRYRIRLREKDNSDKSELIYQNDHKARLSAEYSEKWWSNKLQGDFVYSYYKERSRGWMINDNISVSPLKWLKVTGAFGYFNTNSYDSRIYSYEKSLLYNLYIPAFYGKGIRYSLFVRVDPSKSFSATVRCATTKYFDRDHIGSGYQQINSSHQTDLELQLSYKF